MVGLWSTGCVVQNAPDCAEREDFACFRGMFRTLSSEPVEGVEGCPEDLDELARVTSNEERIGMEPGLPRDTNIALRPF